MGRGEAYRALWKALHHPRVKLAFIATEELGDPPGGASNNDSPGNTITDFI